MALDLNDTELSQLSHACDETIRAIREGCGLESMQAPDRRQLAKAQLVIGLATAYFAFLAKQHGMGAWAWFHALVDGAKASVTEDTEFEEIDGHFVPVEIEERTVQ